VLTSHFSSSRGSGKTTLLIRYCQNRFVTGPATSFIDPQHVGEFGFTLWDTAGSSDSDRLRVLSYPETEVFMVCYDLSLAHSQQTVATRWLPEILRHGPAEAAIVVVGTKADRLVGPVLDVRSTIVAFDTRPRIFSYLTCSSLDNVDVVKAFDAARAAVNSKRKRQAEVAEAAAAGAPKEAMSTAAKHKSWLARVLS